MVDFSLELMKQFFRTAAKCLQLRFVVMSSCQYKFVTPEDSIVFIHGRLYLEFPAYALFADLWDSVLEDYAGDDLISMQIK